MRVSAEKPMLRFTKKSSSEVIKHYFDERTLVLVDEYNSNLKKRFPVNVIIDNKMEQVKKLKEQEADTVIGVGGCTVLDVARMACTSNGKLVLLPTVLSTPCISVKQSVMIDANGKAQTIKTALPSEVVISFPAVLGTSDKNLVRWSSSGYGDLFAKIGASLDARLENQTVKIPKILEALVWAAHSFKSFKKNIAELALYLHEASLLTNERGFILGAEHMLYEAMRRQTHPNNGPTHGQLVSAATLLTARIADEQTRNPLLYPLLRKAYENVGLPLNFGELNSVGISRDSLILGLESIKQTNTHIGRYFSTEDYSLVDAVFK